MVGHHLRVILAGVFLVSSLGQMYYSMMLIPIMLTVVLDKSFVRNWPAWLAAYGFFTLDFWESAGGRTTGDCWSSPIPRSDGCCCCARCW